MPACLDFVCDGPNGGCERGVVLNRVAPSGTPPPPCPVCGGPTMIFWRSSASTGFERPVEFEDDDGTVRHFNSVEEIHRFEKRCEQEVSAGLRSRPFVFREFSQSLSSNRDKNVFQHLHPQVSREKLITRGRDGRPLITGGIARPGQFDEE